MFWLWLYYIHLSLRFYLVCCFDTFVGGTKFASCFICKGQGHISKNCPQNKHGVYPMVHYSKPEWVSTFFQQYDFDVVFFCRVGVVKCVVVWLISSKTALINSTETLLQLRDQVIFPFNSWFDAVFFIYLLKTITLSLAWNDRVRCYTKRQTHQVQWGWSWGRFLWRA